MKILFWNILFLLFLGTEVAAQHPGFICPQSSIFSPKQKYSASRYEQLYLKYLYKTYKGYVVTKNAPYKGIGFQLKSLTVNNEFLEKAHFGFGAFTWDFKEFAGNKVGGVLFNKPVYLGCDFKLKNQLFLSAGTTWLESRNYEGNYRKTQLVNCFIGLTGRFTIGCKK